MRFCGDVHGRHSDYLKLAQEAEYTIQVGDLGFEYYFLDNLDPEKHKVLAGNHDNYHKWNTQKFIYMQTGHWLGDFGIFEVPDFGPIFFARGGFSIDWRYRKEGRDWWPDEEMSYEMMGKAVELYTEIKPDFVVSHECPGSIIDPIFGEKTWDGELLKPSMTAKMLDAMWEIHRPKTWVFGHHHRPADIELNNTRFVCLPELGVLDFDKGDYLGSRETSGETRMDN